MAMMPPGGGGGMPGPESLLALLTALGGQQQGLPQSGNSSAVGQGSMQAILPQILQLLGIGGPQGAPQMGGQQQQAAGPQQQPRGQMSPEVQSIIQMLGQLGFLRTPGAAQQQQQAAPQQQSTPQGQGQI